MSMANKKPCQEASAECDRRWGTSPSRDGVYRCWHHWCALYYPYMLALPPGDHVAPPSPRVCLYDGPTCQGGVTHLHMGGFVCEKHHADAERIRAEAIANPRTPKTIKYTPATYGKK